VFKIFHEQSPALHEQMKQMRKARAELTAAAGGERYDAERVRAAAEAQGKAVTQLALLRAQMTQRVHDLLTPEQRAKLKERFERRHR
jgi:Spy/CpxP family protein refolding chaperone